MPPSGVSLKRSPNSSGASATGTTVCVTNTTGATWIAGWTCNALISASSGHPEAARRGQRPHGRQAEAPLREVVRGQLGRDPAPGEAHAGPEHRDGGRRAPMERAEQIGQHARQRQRHQHDRDRQWEALCRAPRGAVSAAPITPRHDREHRQVLVAPGVLAEHPLCEETSAHNRPAARVRLDDDQRSQAARPPPATANPGSQARAGQPTCVARAGLGRAQPQMLLAGRPLGVCRLEGDP